MNERRRVLVPVTDSDIASAALPAAKRLGETAGGAEIELLHVAESGRSEFKPSNPDMAGIKFLQSTGDPADEICRIAEERDAWMVVMSLQSKTAQRERRLGRTTEMVIRKTDRGVLAIRPDMPEPRRTLARISRVLLPLDGSPAATAAVRPAIDLARSFAARLVLLHVPTSSKNPPAQAGTLAGPRYPDAHHHEWRSWADEFKRRFGGAAVELAEIHAAPGDPGEEILRFAAEHDVDLIGAAWGQSLDPGRAETVKRLLAESPCPLLFVPAHQAEIR